MEQVFRKADKLSLSLCAKIVYPASLWRMNFTAENAKDAEKRFFCCKRKKIVSRRGAENTEKRFCLL